MTLRAPHDVASAPLLLVAGVLLVAGSAILTAAAPFDFLRPVVAVNADDRRTLDGGAAIARNLPSDSGDLGVFSAVAVNIDGKRLAGWIRQIAALKKSGYVTAIRRFSDPPLMPDLDGLTLVERDLEALGNCRLGDCEIKLTRGEIAQLHEAIRSNGRTPDAIQRTFRTLLLARAVAFAERGDESLEPEQRAKVTAFLSRAPFLAERLPDFARYVTGYPRAAAPAGAESFLYWANEHLAGRHVVTLSHVSMFATQADDLPETLVVSRQIFATRYVDVGVAMTMLQRGDRPGQNFLIYMNRTSTDVFDGLFGGLIRPVAQRRVRNEAGTVLEQLRERLQGGPAPAVP